MAIKNVEGIVCPVVRMVCGYKYKLIETGTLNSETVNHFQLRNLALSHYGLKGRLSAPQMITKTVIKSGAL